MVDVVLAVVVLVLMLPQVGESMAFGAPGPMLVVAPALIVLMAAATVARRRWPVVAFAVVIGANVVLIVTTLPIAVFPVFLIIAVAVRRAPSVAWLCAGAAAVLLVLASMIGWHGDPTRGSIASLLFLLIGAMIGTTLGARRRYHLALIELAKGLALERDQRAVIATAAERTRIAREMHDIVAHGLSVMIRLADGADAIAESDPERSRSAVRQVADVGRSSLADMRRALGVLREGTGTVSPAELGPQPTLADLDELVERYRSAGLPVEVRRAGPLDLPDAVQVVVYRGVQEGLTNALRYATAPTRVLVDLDASAADLILTITDDGVGTSDEPSQGSERGLVGLRERAALFDGEVTAGRVLPHGWRVRMTLPGATVRRPGRTEEAT